MSNNLIDNQPPIGVGKAAMFAFRAKPEREGVPQKEIDAAVERFRLYIEGVKGKLYELHGFKPEELTKHAREIHFHCVTGFKFAVDARRAALGIATLLRDKRAVLRVV